MFWILLVLLLLFPVTQANPPPITLDNADSLTLYARFDIPGRHINAVAFSLDGTTLAIGASDANLRLWNLEQGRVTLLGGHNFQVFTVAFSPGGTLLASGSEDGEVILWDLETNTELRRLQPGTRVFSLAFSPDATLLASAGEGGVTVWSVAGDSAQLPGGEDHFTFQDSGSDSVRFSPDGTVLLEGGDRIAQLWSLEADDFGADLGQLNTHIGGGGCGAGVYAAIGESLIFVAEGQQFLMAGCNYVSWWDIDIQEMRFIGGAQEPITVTPDERLLIASRIAELYFIDISQWDVDEWPSVIVDTGGGRLNSVAVSPNGTLIATGDDHGAVQVWQAASME
jgi:WD40 repeat protein